MTPFQKHLCTKLINRNVILISHTQSMNVHLLPKYLSAAVALLSHMVMLLSMART